MGREHKPRGGSLQFWPRKRARRIYPKIRSWAKSDAVKLLGFAGYKVGMTHIIFNDTQQNSLTKGMQVSIPVTIMECAAITPFSVRFYKNTPYGVRLIFEVYASKLDKELARKISLPKKTKDVNEFANKLDDITDIRLLAYTNPKSTNIGRKKPEILEISIGGDNIKEKFEYSKKVLGNNINIKDVFSPGQFIDVHAVSKGKGFQGPIQRFGLALKAAKSEKKKRSGGNLGPWHPSKVSYTVPQHGQMGFHTRTEYNKLIVSIDNDVNKITPKGGFKHYGVIKNDYILVKGSIVGTPKRLIKFTNNIRYTKAVQPLEIKYIDKR